MTVRPFPAGFLWGVATAGHQNEGDNVTSDTWFAEHVTPTVFREPSGKACNGYELWREDIDLVAGMGLTAYRFSVEWARVEPGEGRFADDALDHYEAMVDRCVERGLAPVITFNHFTSPHWFAMRGSWLDGDAPSLFARYCDRVMARFGDRIAIAVTMNEPNLARLLTWLDFPDVVRELERATLTAASEAAGVPRYRLANVMLPEEMDAMADGMAAGHRAAKAAIKGRRPELPVGLSVAVVDDVVVGEDPSVRDRKRTDVYERWLELAREDDFVGLQNYERIYYDGSGAVPPPADAALNQMGSGVGTAVARRCWPLRPRGNGRARPRDRARHEHRRRFPAGRLHRAVARRPARRCRGRCPGARVPVLDADGQLRVDLGYGHQLGLHSVDRDTFVSTAKPSAAVYAAIARGHALPER